MELRFPVVDPDIKLETVHHFLNEYHAVLVHKGEVVSVESSQSMTC
jgi:predicted transcriptional regulator